MSEHIDPVEEAFRRKRRADAESDRVLKKSVSFGAAIGTFVLNPVVGLPALLGRVIETANDMMTGRELDQLSDRADVTDERVAETERRLASLESAGGGTRVRGAAAQLLAAMVDTELSAVFTNLDSDAAMSTLNLTAEEYREAVQELEYLGLAWGDGNANHATGYARTHLAPTAILRAGPALRPDLPWEDDLSRILVSIQRDQTPGHLFLTTTLLERTGIPLPRLDLELRALADFGVIEDRGGPAHPTYGNYRAIELTVRGRRVLRGDETVL